MVPSNDGGEKNPFEYLRNRSSTAACASGVLVVNMSSVSPWRVNGGGLTGYGCRSESRSPSIADGGTLRDSIGNSGAPVRRSRT
jgi:hypothetical protein